VTSVLAIDPAWTADQPSGVVLLHEVVHGWQCSALAPSYEQFVTLANGFPVDWSTDPTPTRPVVADLLGAAERMLKGSSVDLVTVDMPLSTSAISSRRTADNAISKKFGGRGCGTHTPSATRPGPISDVLCAEFRELGYPLATVTTPPGTSPALIEVYPHPALLVLMDAPYRVQYKVSKAGRYWPKVPPSERRRKLVEKWYEIRQALGETISGAELPLPTPDEAEHLRTSGLKRFEDALDALICGWVGVRYLDRHCTAFGDETAAIWTP
jgi:predicted RNase H-like nuclease